MKKINATYRVEYRRKREGKTNYKKRLNTLKTDMPRLVVRKFSKNFLVQVIQYDAEGDKILASADSVKLKKFGWNSHAGNLPAAYLIGLIAGKEAMKKNIKNAVLDIGLQTSTKGSRLYAALKGALDAGMSINHSPEMLPSEDTVSGKKIDEYKKSGISKSFADVKNKIK